MLQVVQREVVQREQRIEERVAQPLSPRRQLLP
jgi:hypothetical protein